MDISIDEVKYIAKLCKLEFTDDEASKLLKEFHSILTHFESIDKLDLSDVNIDVPTGNTSPSLREDVTSTFENKEKLFRNTKSMSNTSIKVPKIIE